jgi:SAM-dependent methyltransferase
MDPHAAPSGGNVAAGRPSPVVLRLLPFVHHPPARVLVASSARAAGVDPSREATALEARGYRVTAADSASAAEFLDSDHAGAFDLVCECSFLSSLPPASRARWANAAARALRPGGKLFGAFLQVDEPDRASPPYGIGASELIALLSGAFDVERLQPSDFGAPAPGASQLEAIFVRR